MTKTTILTLLASFLILLSQAKEQEIQSEVTTVTIYHSGARVFRTSSAQLKPGVNEILLRNVSSKIVLNSLKIDNKEVTVLNKQVIQKLTDEEYQQLLDRKEAISKQMELLENKFNEVGFVASVEDLEKMTAFYSNRIIQGKKELRAIDEEIRKAEELENIDIQNEDAGILKLTISIEGELKTPLKLQYVCGGIGWSPSYDLVVESASDTLIQMKYMAKVMSQTGEDWDNVKINLSSSFPLESPTRLPEASSPWVLDNRKSPMTRPTSVNGETDPQNQEVERLEGVEYKQLRVPAF
ncbi:MAG: DUF4139 domain-containing protein, partial [Bacteroidota bacterium]